MRWLQLPPAHLQGRHNGAIRKIKLAEICAACQLADDGHNQSLKSNIFAECAADDYADSHIYHIAFMANSPNS